MIVRKMPERKHILIPQILLKRTKHELPRFPPMFVLIDSNNCAEQLSMDKKLTRG